jgi:RNA polymerase sigma-70 factor (ECF subfamily)
MAHSIHHEIEELLPRLVAFARYLTKNPADADDLVQSSVERALQRIDQFTPGTNLKAWLFTIMRNLYINEIRRLARRGTTADASECEDLFPVAACQDDRLVWRDFMRAYATLPDVHKRVIDLVAVDGWSYQEAADMLEVPVGTIRSRLSRARTHLSTYYDDAGDNVVAPMAETAEAAVLH